MAVLACTRRTGRSLAGRPGNSSPGGGVAPPDLIVRPLAVAALCFACSFPSPTCGQGIPFSQHGTVSQRVGFTDITIAYNRPVAHGWTLFGKLVPWGKVWHPGAD